MHAGELLEMAAVVCNHGPSLIADSTPIAAEGLKQYRAASLYRIHKWLALLDSFFADDAHEKPDWPTVRIAFEEIITGEVLARTFAALLCLHDRKHPENPPTEPLAREVLGRHLRPRNQMLKRLIESGQSDSHPSIPENRSIPATPSIAVDEAQRLLDLCRRAERWTDMLIGYLGDPRHLSDYTTNPQRACEFAKDLRARDPASPATGRSSWPLLEVSLRAAFERDLSGQATEGRVNQKIALAILASMVGDRTPAPPKTSVLLDRSRAWEKRIWATADKAQALLDGYFNEFSSPSSPTR